MIQLIYNYKSDKNSSYVESFEEYSEQGLRTLVIAEAILMLMVG